MESGEASVAGAAIAVGYALLVTGHSAAPAVCLVLGYGMLVPTAIMRDGFRGGAPLKG